MRAATLDTNSFTVDLIRGPSELGSVYSMIRSLEKKKIEKTPSIWKLGMEETLFHFWDLLWFERGKCGQSQSIYGQMDFLVFVQYEKVFLLDVIISSVWNKVHICKTKVQQWGKLFHSENTKKNIKTKYSFKPDCIFLQLFQTIWVAMHISNYTPNVRLHKVYCVILIYFVVRICYL